MRSGTICCISHFNANDNGVSPSESRKFKLTVATPSLGPAVIVSKNEERSQINYIEHNVVNCN